MAAEAAFYANEFEKENENGNLFNEKSSKNIPVSEESWPKLKRCTVCKREFKEFPNTVPSDVCSLQYKAHADLDFSTTL